MSIFEKDSRTEQATPRQHERFREEGKVAVSKDVMSLAVLAGGTVALVASASAAGMALMGVAKEILGHLHENSGSGLTPSQGKSVLEAFMWCTVPVAAATALCTLAAGLSQTQWLWSSNVLVPDFTKLNPLPKLQQLFSGPATFKDIGLAAIKVAIVGGLAAKVLWQSLDRILRLPDQPAATIPAFIGGMMAKLVFTCVAALVAVAVLDFFLVRRRMREQMKMTKQEVKQEHRDQEGDPSIRRRQRAQARAMRRNRLIAAVPKADVVIVNPTHYAVALRYDPIRMRAPQVVAKGKERIAAIIRELARRHQVPILQNPPVARRLFAACRVDQEVPENLYSVVAEVLAAVYRMRRTNTPLVNS